jgi:TRAP-type C4-dicarboxylate transport system permease small subunit
MLKAIVERLTLLGAGIAAASLFLMVIMTVLGAVSRYLFGAPLSWAMELPSYSLALCTALALAYTQKVRGHIAVDFMEGHLSGRGRAWLHVLLYPVYFAVVLFVTAAAFRLMRAALIEGRFSDVLRFPLFVLHVFIFVGFLLYCLQLILDFRLAIAELSDSGNQAAPSGQG